jgi:RNA polymerase sigma-70 factor (ECF subfamily)
VPREFEEVYAQHLVPVWRYVRARVAGRADAEDLTSEVFTRALRAWGRYDERRGSPGAWLMGIAQNVVADWWRRAGRELPVEDVESASPSSPDPGPQDAALAGESREELRRHLGRLTEKERDAVALRFGGGLRAAEVGAALGVSETAARMLVYRAVSKLREVMVVE